MRNKAKKNKHGIEAGTKVKLLEDQFGRIVLQPITEDYVDRVMGCLGKGPDLLAAWGGNTAKRVSMIDENLGVRCRCGVRFSAEKARSPQGQQPLEEAMRGRAEILMSAVNNGECTGGSFVTTDPIRRVKVKHKLYYVDGFAAALAIELKGTLVTSDSDFCKLGHVFPVAWLKV